MTLTQKLILGCSALILSANLALSVGGCGKGVPAITGGTELPYFLDPKDPTAVIANQKATIEELKKAIDASKAETKVLEDKYRAAIADAIIAKLWLAFGICCLAVVACGAAAWFLPLFRSQAIQGIVFCSVAAALCLVLMKLVPHMWQIAWGVGIVAIALIVFYFLRHMKGVSTAFAWTSEFAQKVGEDVKGAAQKEKFFVDKLATSKVLTRDGLKKLRDKALGVKKDVVVKPVNA